MAYRTAREPPQWALRRCTCSFCIRFAGVYTSDPPGEIVLRSKLALRTYQFGQRTADFLFCSACGVYFGAMADIGGQKRAVLNVRVLDDVALDVAAAQPMDFEE